MTEQQLRAAVAEYDAEMARDADYDYTTGSLRLEYYDSHVEWIMTEAELAIALEATTAALAKAGVK